MLTTDPIYYKPLVPTITIFDKTQASTLYTYNPFTDVGTTAKPVSLNVDLSTDHSGIFTLQIENNNFSLNTTTINKGCKVLIGCGKQSTQITNLAWFLVRKSGYTRGKNGKVLYTLSGSTPQIRNNERIIYYVKEARKLAQDGKTLDLTDPAMKADTLLQNAYNLDSSYPLNKDDELSEGVTWPYIDTSVLATNSTVENIVASVNVEMGEIQNLINLLEEQTNGEMQYTTTSTLFQGALRYQYDPLTSGRGFTIKNTKGTTDDADDTCYLRGGNWEYEESIYKPDYSNRLFGTFAGEPDPTEVDINTYTLTATGDTSANYIAQKFRPTTPNPDRILLAMTATGTPTTALYIDIRPDSANSPNPFPSFINDFMSNPPVPGLGGAAAVATPQLVEFVRPSNLTPNIGLDMTKDYWLTLVKGGTGANHYNWLYKNQTNANYALSPAIGTNFVSNANLLFAFWIPRRPKIFEASDYKGRTAVGLIESPLTSTPTTVKTYEAMYEYLSNQLYYMARPRVNWNQPTVTSPNTPIFPGDPLMIQDTILGFSTTNTKVVMATAGPMNYSWQIGQYQAPTILSLQPISNPTRYN